MTKNLLDYVTKRIELIKMQLIEKSSITIGMIVYLLIILVAFIFSVIIFNFAIAFMIGQKLDNYAYGFLIVAAFYLFFAIITLILKKRIKNFVSNKIVKLL